MKIELILQCKLLLLTIDWARLKFNYGARKYCFQLILFSSQLTSMAEPMLAPQLYCFCVILIDTHTYCRTYNYTYSKPKFLAICMFLIVCSMLNSRSIFLILIIAQVVLDFMQVIFLKTMNYQFPDWFVFSQATQERGILQEVEQNKEGMTDESAEKGRTVSIADGKEARTLDVFWFLKPCTLSN